MTQDSLVFKNDFAEIVLAHAKTLPGERWRMYRDRAERRVELMDDVPTTPNATPEQVVQESLSSSGLSVQDIMNVQHFRNSAQEIAKLQGSPVYYIHGAGYYCWGITETIPNMLDVTLTYPCYPIGW